MATTANLSSIIRFYAEKQKSPFIDFHEFCAYLKKYAEHHVEETPELVKYLGDPSDTVTAEVQGLTAKRVATMTIINKKKVIVSVAYCSLVYANKYKEIYQNEAVPYPIRTDLPKNFPPGILEMKTVSDFVTESISNHDPKSPLLYIIQFNHEIPDMLIPACIPLDLIISTARAKVRKILAKDEYHDYFLKKLRSSNQGKEITIQSFFNNFVENKNQTTDVKQAVASDDYYYWSQLCYYIRQDFEKIQDRTLEDNNILQAIEYTECFNTYMKQKLQADQKRADALKELSFNLNKPPYIYSMDQILKFKDQSGRLLYGQFSEEDLKEFLKRESFEPEARELPHLLNFKVASGTKYFIFKNNVIPLTVRLCNEAHHSIEKTLVDRWYGKLLDYDKLPEMTSPKLFDECLKSEVQSNSPILWALLNANFMSLLSYEKSDVITLDSGRIFDGNELLPYTDLLMLKFGDIMSQAKMKLPFYYTIPILSWIIAMLSGKKKSAKKTSNKSTAMTVDFDAIHDDEDENEEDEKKKSSGSKKSKKEKIAEIAEDLTKDFVPEGSTVDRELDFLCKQWNRMIGTETRMNLTEDVNSLIRDYMRKVVSTLTASTFTVERVKSLARALVKTPNMQKIKDEESLTQYVELYILKLLTNK